MTREHARPWRTGSTYSEPPRNALDRHQRHVWRRRVVAEARAGNLPPGAILTAEALLACMGEDGQLFPSHRVIAGKSGNGVRTIARHLARMAELGLLTRLRRLARRPWPEGGRGAVRVEQASNAYVLLSPQTQITRQQATICRLQTSQINTGGHVGPVEARRLIPTVPAVDRVAALAALEAVRVAREAAATARWLAMRC